jgi:hypothetical protein
MSSHRFDEPATFESESSIPTLSDISRSLIEGRIEPERYIAERRRQAEQFARREVEQTTMLSRRFEVVVGAIAGSAAVAAALLSLRSQTAWLLALTAGAIGVSVVTSLWALQELGRRTDQHSRP